MVIPARFAAKRLPGKPLIEFGGRPLLQHVYQAAVNSRAAEVIIATDDGRIETAARGFGARVVMTSPSHRTGTDRIAETVGLLQLPGSRIVVNVQGDELGLPPALIDQVAGNLAGNGDASMASLYAPIASAQEMNNPNCVKVVADARGYALMFSRSAIPWNAPDKGCRHIGIYAYTCDFLKNLHGIACMWTGTGRTAGTVAGAVPRLPDPHGASRGGTGPGDQYARGR